MIIGANHVVDVSLATPCHGLQYNEAKYNVTKQLMILSFDQ